MTLKTIYFLHLDLDDLEIPCDHEEIIDIVEPLTGFHISSSNGKLHVKFELLFS